MTSKDLDSYLIDKRMVQRNMNKKMLSRKEFEDYLTFLNDDENKCEGMETREEKSPEKK